MKRFRKRLLSFAMTLVLAVIPVCQTYASSGGGAEKQLYISEVKIGTGKTAEEAAASLEGYTLLKDGEQNADLNQGAEGGYGSLGPRVVLLGYKTTSDPKDAITDLAVMNMKGGYSVQEYEALMEKQMKEQIIPFVENFRTTLAEYRANYKSKIPANKARATYLHDVLNRFTDDDTGGKLGDLFLKETKYEIGDSAYEALPENKKKEHADILTILAQGNGTAILTIENLLTRAADTGKDSWVTRLSASSLDDLIDDLNLPPTEARKELAKRYDSDAQKLLSKWSEFRDLLSGYEDAEAAIEAYDLSAYEKAVNDFQALTETTPAEEAARIIEVFRDEEQKKFAFETAVRTMTVYNYLQDTEYDGGTLADFFLQEQGDMEADISELYPLVSALSPGQRAGLDFVSLLELVCIAMTDENGYNASDLTTITEASIYDGVDRAIYAKGGVALTSDALRLQAASQTSDESLTLSKWTILTLAVAGGCFIALTASARGAAYWSAKARPYQAKIDELKLLDPNKTFDYTTPNGSLYYASDSFEAINRTREEMQPLVGKSTLCNYLTVGFSIAMIVVLAVSVYFSYQDLADFYNVEFTPIPHYMVDEKDITAFNESGEKVVLNNQRAYYRAVTCGRTEADERYASLGDCADLNGDVGKQWLALYYLKNDTAAPILADSLLVKVNDPAIPSGYSTGIHMFGSDAAMNLNNELYCWNASAPSVFVYFQTDTSPIAGAASGFSSGTFFLFGGGGLVIGLVIGVLIATIVRKKKEKTQAA